MRCVTFCWLLVALPATTALAQTRPAKKLIRKPVVGQNKWPTRMQDQEDAFIQHSYELPDTAHRAQPAPPDTNRVYTYVEQMPTLNGQGSFAAIATAIQRQLLLPLAAPAGRTFVQFVVTQKGVVTKPRIIKGLRADVDSAVVAATRKLPRFKPGKQDGRVVAVSYTLVVSIGAPAVLKPVEAGGKK